MGRKRMPDRWERALLKGLRHTDDLHLGWLAGTLLAKSWWRAYARTADVLDEVLPGPATDLDLAVAATLFYRGRAADAVLALDETQLVLAWSGRGGRRKPRTVTVAGAELRDAHWATHSRGCYLLTLQADRSWPMVLPWSDALTQEVDRRLRDIQRSAAEALIPGAELSVLDSPLVPATHAPLGGEREDEADADAQTGVEVARAV